MNVIEAQGISKRYRRMVEARTIRSLLEGRTQRVDFWAIRDISLSVERGETVGVIGANGSGKSTLLRIMAGITRPTEGRLDVRARVSGLLTLGEGFHAELSGTEAAVTGAVLAGYSRREARRLLPSIAEFAELESQMDQPLRTYSNGQRLRLAFSVAININPQILMIDEILSVGDLAFQEKCLLRIERIKESGTTLVMATHNLADVERLCNRAIYLADGRVVEQGPSDKVVSAYRLRSTKDEVTELPSVMRVGSGEVRIARVRVLNQDGAEIQVIDSGQGVTIEIEYSGRSAITDAIAGIAMHTKPDGRQCLDLSTLGDRGSLLTLAPPGSLTLELDRLDLASGTYAVEVGLYSRTWEPFDYLWEGAELRVVGGSDTGLIAPPRRWR